LDQDGVYDAGEVDEPDPFHEYYQANNNPDNNFKDADTNDTEVTDEAAIQKDEEDNLFDEENREEDIEIPECEEQFQGDETAGANEEQPQGDATAGVHDEHRELEQEMDYAYGERTGRYDLTPLQPRDYSHLHTTLEHTVMTQYTLK
jgi:hypothetical protein